MGERGRSEKVGRERERSERVGKSESVGSEGVQRIRREGVRVGREEE